mmetsp:Transcript_10717/g.11484  ORF Transcript_10717/g.11484 Transcript_10717/m.11484 type:complete len:134 (+) Transcript_10717:224-625(+)
MKSPTSVCGGISLFDTFGIKEIFNCGSSSLSDVHVNNNHNEDHLYQHHHHHHPHLHALLAEKYNHKNYSALRNDIGNILISTSPTYSKDMHNELRKRQRLERRAEQQQYQQHQPSLLRNNSTGRSTFSASSDI